MKIDQEPGNDPAARPHLTRRVFGGGLRFGHKGAVGGLKGATLAWTAVHLAMVAAFVILFENHFFLAGQIVFAAWVAVVLLVIITHRSRVRRRLRRLGEESAASMPENPFIQIDAPHLGVVANEWEESINEGIFGKALAESLCASLRARGFEVPGVFCEDWGWYVSVRVDGFSMGIAVYGAAGDDFPEDPGPDDVGAPLSLCVNVGTEARKYWDWRRFRRVDRSEDVARLHAELLALFEEDPKITVVGCTDEFPLGRQ